MKTTTAIYTGVFKLTGLVFDMDVKNSEPPRMAVVLMQKRCLKASTLFCKIEALKLAGFILTRKLK
ncbi:hypothetical protein HMPREF9554_02594 [Treponema phagedenis F0421]|nr:hypothetical protein HMPREF9554_02594 [Treponema phagedenis F0421]